MTRKDQAYSVFDQIARKGSKPASLSFKKFGIKTPVSASTIANAVGIHGKPFIDDLYNRLTADYSSSDGNPLAKLNFSDLLTVASQILGYSNSKTTETPAQTATQEPLPEPKKVFGIPVPAAVGIAIIIVLIIVLLLIRKK